MKARCKARQAFIIQLSSNAKGGYLPTQIAVDGGSYGSKPVSTMVRLNGQVVHPAPVAVVPDHDGADEASVLQGAQHRGRRPRERAIEVGVRVVPGAREPGLAPERDGVRA